MRSRWVPVLGWVEYALGFIFLLVSVIGLFYDNAELRVLLWDSLTFVLLLSMIRAPLLGFALLIVAAFGGLVVDADGIGMSHYIAACGVVLAVRLGRMPLAVGLFSNTPAPQLPSTSTGPVGVTTISQPT